MAKKSTAVAADVPESTTIALPVPAVQSNPDIQKICDYLSEEGFRPKIDPDGAIGFKCESWKIYLDAYADNHGFRMYTCVFGELEPNERTYALSVANTINSERRYIKAVLTNGNTVWITYESTCADVTEYSRTLSRLAESLVSAGKSFREEFRRISQPITLN